MASYGNPYPMQMTRLECCGMREIASLSSFSSPEMALKAFGKTTYGTKRDPRESVNPWGEPNARFRFVVFSQAKAPGGGVFTYGDKFAEYILKHNLGTLVEAPQGKNPNTGNAIKAWIWTIWNHERVSEHIAGLWEKDGESASAVAAQVNR